MLLVSFRCHVRPARLYDRRQSQPRSLGYDVAQICCVHVPLLAVADNNHIENLASLSQQPGPNRTQGFVAAAPGNLCDCQSFGALRRM